MVCGGGLDDWIPDQARNDGKDSDKGLFMALKKGWMRRVVGRVVVSAGLVWLALWMLEWGLASRMAASGAYTPKMAQTLAAFPKAMARLGAAAWVARDMPQTIRFYRLTVSRDPLNLGAWLTLAEAEEQAGNPGQAREILTYVHQQGERTLRWTWSETLLALDLEEYDRVWDNLNRLIKAQRHTNDALQLAHALSAGEPGGVAARLDTANLGVYLSWLMRWGWLDAALAVAAEMDRQGVPDSALRAGLAHRLLGRKQVPEAMALLGVPPGQVTHPGFETESAGQGFDWRISSRPDKGWQVERVTGTARQGSHAMAVAFSGQKNSSFAHLSQIVPVTPGATYALTAWWKGEGLTTDRGPFIEVYGYDRKGLHIKGPERVGTWDWEKVSLDFSVPDGCHAVVVRLSRRPSRKLDNKIEGRVWVDDFRLELLS
ncbi:MAG: hypothetical protein K9M96_16125 [Deltaproteobacteria bacterium]|nr:hypothetical protein [Deltaproteobacteria bacterium]